MVGNKNPASTLPAALPARRNTSHHPGSRERPVYL
jgi:hypothetical protein